MFGFPLKAVAILPTYALRRRPRSYRTSAIINLHFMNSALCSMLTCQWCGGNIITITNRFYIQISLNVWALNSAVKMPPLESRPAVVAQRETMPHYSARLNTVDCPLVCLFLLLPFYKTYRPFPRKFFVCAIFLNFSFTKLSQEYLVVSPVF